MKLAPDAAEVLQRRSVPVHADVIDQAIKRMALAAFCGQLHFSPNLAPQHTPQVAKTPLRVTSPSDAKEIPQSIPKVYTAPVLSDTFAKTF